MAAARNRSALVRSTLVVVAVLLSTMAMSLVSSAFEPGSHEPSAVRIDEQATDVGFGPGWVTERASDSSRRSVSLLPFLAVPILAATFQSRARFTLLFRWCSQVRDILAFDRLGSRGPPEFASLS